MFVLSSLCLTVQQKLSFFFINVHEMPENCTSICNRSRDTGGRIICPPPPQSDKVRNGARSLRVNKVAKKSSNLLSNFVLDRMYSAKNSFKCKYPLTLRLHCLALYFLYQHFHIYIHYVYIYFIYVQDFIKKITNFIVLFIS